MAQAQQEVQFAEVTPVRPVTCGNLAVTVRIACGNTDLHRGIDGLAVLVQQQFNLEQFTNTLFLFCGRRRDRIKGLYWEGNGICPAMQTSGVRFFPVAPEGK